MGALQELVAASFRGVPFLVPNGTVESGRHAVRHEFPDSNTRFIEDNGLRVPDFKVTAVVSEPGALAKMRRLETALKTPGPGTLVHPTHGRQFVQVNTYHLHHKDSEVGIYTFDIVFHVTGPPVFPGLLSGIAASITGLSALALVGLFNSFVSQVSSLAISALSGATFAVVVNAIGSVASHVSAAFGSVAGVRAATLALIGVPGRIVSDTAAFAGNMQALFEAPFAATDTVLQSDLWRGYMGMLTLAREQTAAALAIPTSTVDYTIRREVLLLTATALQAASFVALCHAAAGKKYETAEQIEVDVAVLVDAFDGLAELDLLTADRNRLSGMLSETVAVLQRLEVTLPRVVSFAVPEMPASVLAYMLYDSDDKQQTLVGLNAGQNPILYNGAVNVLRNS